METVLKYQINTYSCLVYIGTFELNDKDVDTFDLLVEDADAYVNAYPAYLETYDITLDDFVELELPFEVQAGGIHNYRKYIVNN